MSPLLRIITVIMSPLLRIITRSIIRNNGFIITYYRPGLLGDEGGWLRPGPGALGHCKVPACSLPQAAGPLMPILSLGAGLDTGRAPFKVGLSIPSPHREAQAAAAASAGRPTARQLQGHCEVACEARSLRPPHGGIFFFPSVFQIFTTKGAFSPEPLSFSPHHISKFRVRHETRRLGYAPLYTRTG